MANIMFANKYSTAGLDVEGIQKIKDAINAYIKALEKAAEALDTTKNTEWNALVESAIKGNNAVAGAKSHITSICTECKNDIGLFNSFITALDSLEERYRKNDNSCTDIEMVGQWKFVTYKPVIYLYPEEETNIELKFEKNEENLLSTYPKYDRGWKVTAHPNGDLYDQEGNYYYTLFWDAVDNSEIDLGEGFVVEGKDVTKFLKEKLQYIGLNGKEINEFIIYWIDKLENNKYNYIRFRQTEEVNKYMPLKFNKKPDTLIRVIMDYRALNEKVEVREQKLTKYERKGFTVVEWGGRKI